MTASQKFGLGKRLGSDTTPMDFTDPETWKSATALLDSWKGLLTAGLGLLTVIGSIWGAVSGWFRKAYLLLRSKIRLARPLAAAHPEARPLRFVQDARQSIWSSCGKPSKDGPTEGTQVVGEWHVTNLTDRNVVLLKVRLEGYEAADANAFTQGLRERVYARITAIPAGSMGRVMAHLFYFPPIISGTEALIADVIFTDNYEEEHRVPAARFRSIRS